MKATIVTDRGQYVTFTKGLIRFTEKPVWTSQIQADVLLLLAKKLNPNIVFNLEVKL